MEPTVINAIRAMCRICLNVSDPANGLVLKGNFQCFAPSLLSQLGCLLDKARPLPECQPFVTPSYSAKVTVKAEAGVYYNTTNGVRSLQYLAMAFRSVSQC